MKAPLKLTLVVLAGLGLGGVLLRQNALSKARSENEMLQHGSQEAERLGRENTEMNRLRAENREIEKLRKETGDLHKLRNEVRQLREQVKGLASVRTENERLRSAGARSGPNNPQGGESRQWLTKDNVQFAGYATPEATLQTLFWAIKQGDLESALKCISDDARKDIGDQSPEEMRHGMTEMVQQLKGLRIAARKNVSAEEAHVGVQVNLDGRDKPEEHVIPFKLVGGEWRLGGMK